MQPAFLRQRFGSAPPEHPSATRPGRAPRDEGRVGLPGVMSGEGPGTGRVGKAGGGAFLEQCDATHNVQRHTIIKTLTV